MYIALGVPLRNFHVVSPDIFWNPSWYRVQTPDKHSCFGLTGRRGELLAEVRWICWDGSCPLRNGHELHIIIWLPELELLKFKMFMRVCGCLCVSKRECTGQCVWERGLLVGCGTDICELHHIELRWFRGSFLSRDSPWRVTLTHELMPPNSRVTHGGSCCRCCGGYLNASRHATHRRLVLPGLVLFIALACWVKAPSPPLRTKTHAYTTYFMYGCMCMYYTTTWAFVTKMWCARIFIHKYTHAYVHQQIWSWAKFFFCTPGKITWPGSPWGNVEFLNLRQNFLNVRNQNFFKKRLEHKNFLINGSNSSLHGATVSVRKKQACQ